MSFLKRLKRGSEISKAKSEAQAFKRGVEKEKKLEQEIAKLESREKQLSVFHAKREQLAKLEKRKRELLLKTKGKPKSSELIRIGKKLFKFR